MSSQRSPISSILFVCFLFVSTWITIIGSVPCVPVQGKTALVVGQDFYSITNYTTAFDAIPFGVMSYTALRSDTGDLTGLLDPIDYGRYDLINPNPHPDPSFLTPIIPNTVGWNGHKD